MLNCQILEAPHLWFYIQREAAKVSRWMWIQRPSRNYIWEEWCWDQRIMALPSHYLNLLNHFPFHLLLIVSIDFFMQLCRQDSSLLPLLFEECFFWILIIVLLINIFDNDHFLIYSWIYHTALCIFSGWVPHCLLNFLSLNGQANGMN